MARADVAALRAFELGNLPLHPPRTDRLVGSLHWGAGVSASLPLFEGGGRRTARTRASRDVDELRQRRRSIAERIEQRVRSAAHLAGASFAGIEVAEAATVEARQNLDRSPAPASRVSCRFFALLGGRGREPDCPSPLAQIRSARQQRSPKPQDRIESQSPRVSQVVLSLTR